MSDGNHFVTKCKYCGVIINQCRCISKDKEVKYATCGTCAQKLANGEIKTINNENYIEIKRG